uniref:Uncharacterized protein n=1 Tax=Caenorhabditis japonica TaxID=281687 RepID=A0A8R1EQR0_CAEJA
MAQLRASRNNAYVLPAIVASKNHDDQELHRAGIAQS